MISAVILSHNSQTTLEATLRSVSWCDECIVVDDRSTDKTSDIVKKYHARIFTRALHDDFASQRNFGLEKANHDWILFVDSDEVVPDALAREIQKSIRQNIRGFYVQRQDVMWGRALKHGETAHAQFLRLAQKGAGIWKEPVHEQWDVQGHIGQLKTPLLHYPHPDVAQFLSQINMYSSIRAKYLFDHGVCEPWWKVIVNPGAKFFVNYVWFLGFLDGMPGAIIAILMSFHSFLVRAKLWHMWQVSRRNAG
jgi:glycosyltransferase involved in cell wall biosynthesis